MPTPPHFSVNASTATVVRSRLLETLHMYESVRRQGLVSAFVTAGIRPPRCLVSTSQTAGESALDRELVTALSQLVSREHLSLPELVETWRAESPTDPRPNKALDPTWLNILLHDYPLRTAVVDAASRGVTHMFISPRPPDVTPVDNHGSARRYRTALERSLADGQRSGTYLVVTTTAALQWKQLRYSPFGCVPKKDADPSIEARLIHDLSCPQQSSTNACSDQSQLPLLLFESVQRIACRIEELAVKNPGHTIKMLKGDVKSAFRHIPVASSLAAHFAGSYLHNLTVVDLSLPFGWTGSPAHYGAFGGAVSFLVSRESPRSLDPYDSDSEPFFSFVWVDDHVLIEPDIGRRTELAEAALRLSMLAVLGPNAINDKKFSSWETSLQALGLIWDTTMRCVSMPPDKVNKATARIAKARSSQSVSKHQLAQLLGSLRHVGLCCRATRAFLQRLHGTWRRAPLFGTVRLSTDELDDLNWVETLLTHNAASNVPTCVLAGTISPSINLFMDASDEGLCVLFPAAREYIRVQFDEEERSLIAKPKDPAATTTFSINVREMLSAVYAVIVWGPRWSHHGRTHEPLHVLCWIDNVAAVSWIRRHHSRNVFGQELSRVLSCAELMFNITLSTSHLEGARNTLADLGSRGWAGSKLTEWATHVSTWTEQVVPLQYRKIYKPVSSTSNGSHLQTHRENNTSELGTNGATSAPRTASRVGSLPVAPPINHYSSLCSQFAAGSRASMARLSDTTPYGINSAMSAGVISSPPASDHNSHRNTILSSTPCADSVRPAKSEGPSPSRCSKPLPPPASYTSPNTASFVGLRCWASSSASAGPSTSPPMDANDIDTVSK